MALDLTRCYLTQTDCTEVFAFAGNYTLTTSTTPTLAQVEGFCYTASALIEAQTERAGLLTSPPASGISPTRLKQLLTDANAIGAAYLARLQMYVANQDEDSLRAAQALAGLWQTYMGEGSINVSAGLHALQMGTGGLISQAIQSASGSAVLVTAVSRGEVELASLDSRLQDITFTITDID